MLTMLVSANVFLNVFFLVLVHIVPINPLIVPILFINKYLSPDGQFIHKIRHFLNNLAQLMVPLHQH